MSPAPPDLNTSGRWKARKSIGKSQVQPFFSLPWRQNSKVKQALGKSFYIFLVDHELTVIAGMSVEQDKSVEMAEGEAQSDDL